MSIIIDKTRCIECGKCIKMCQNNIFTKRENIVEVITKHEHACILCGRCLSVCEQGAIFINEINPDKLVKVDKKAIDELQRTTLFKTRRSVRNYTDQVPSKEIIEQAFDDARFAPTARNQQEVEWVVVLGRDKMRAISDETASVFLDAAGHYKNIVNTYNKGIDVFLRGAPALVIAHAPNESAWSAQDCTAALSYLELSLHSRGLGSCWAGFVLVALGQKMFQSLPIPENRVAKAGLMIGYPSVDLKIIPPRKELRITYI